MISFDFSSHCTGCCACVDVCPKRCIEMRENKLGFRIPYVNLTDCVNCNLCEKVCPIISEPKLSSCKLVYSAYNKNDIERKCGSSGSVMLLLARNILSKGGAVYGAAFDDYLQLHHTRATSYEQLLLQSKSKYIQSDLQGIFNAVKKDVKNGIPTMFVGTPCQTQALSNFLGDIMRNNLLLIDFICHGVPSQNLFNQAITEYERKHRCKVTSFSFREKNQQRLRNYKIVYQQDGVEIEETGKENQFPFFCGYLKYITFRDSCYECKFAKNSRVSDITLGDLWGNENNPDFHKGYSLVYINTEKGESALKQINSSIEYAVLSSDDPITYNFAYNHHQEKDLWHRLYVFMISHFSYRTTERFLFHSYQDVCFLHKCAFLIIGKMNKYYLYYLKKRKNV